MSIFYVSVKNVRDLKAIGATMEAMDISFAICS